MTCSYAAITDIGLSRDNNQDSIYAQAKNEFGLFVVADGMGGYSDGEIASARICEELKTWWESFDKNGKISSADLIEELSIRINQKSRAIYDEFAEKAIKGGTTVCALIIMGNTYAVVSVGDSRTYLIQNEVKQLTIDDVWENLPEFKDWPEEKKLADPRYGKLTQAVGFDEEIIPRIVRGVVSKGMRFLVCSDGVYKYCYESELKKIMKNSLFEKTTERMVRDIKKCVESHGAGDNFSAIVCSIR